MFDYSTLAKYFSGNITESEKVEVDLWTREGNNRKVLEELHGLWEISGKISQAETVNVDVAWAKFRNRIATRPLRPFGKVRTRKRLGLAAMFVAVLAAALLLVQYLAGSSADPAPGKSVLSPSARGYGISASDTVVEFSLPDSTRVWLNKGGEIRLLGNFSGRHRALRLKGEAFFEVREDKQRPFYVRTAHSLTRVTGTAFNIEETGNKLEVEVRQGEVEIISGNATGYVKLRAGQTVTMTDGGMKKIIKDHKCANWWQNIPCKVKRIVQKIRKNPGRQL